MKFRVYCSDPKKIAGSKRLVVNHFITEMNHINQQCRRQNKNWSKVLRGVFRRRFRNARLLQWLVFFVSSTRSVHFLSLFNIINLNYQNILETPEPRPKQKHRRPEPRKHRTPFGVFHSDFFRHSATFFGFHQRVSPSFVSIFCNTMDVKKS